jgi:hypothetical protein
MAISVCGASSCPNNLPAIHLLMKAKPGNSLSPHAILSGHLAQ